MLHFQSCQAKCTVIDALDLDYERYVWPHANHIEFSLNYINIITPLQKYYQVMQSVIHLE
jgi:hypothetical protein